MFAKKNACVRETETETDREGTSNALGIGKKRSQRRTKENDIDKQREKMTKLNEGVLNLCWKKEKAINASIKEKKRRKEEN